MSTRQNELAYCQHIASQIGLKVQKRCIKTMVIGMISLKTKNICFFFTILETAYGSHFCSVPSQFQVPPYNNSFVSILPSLDCRQVPVGPLHAEKMTEEVFTPCIQNRVSSFPLHSRIVVKYVNANLGCSSVHQKKETFK